jgi:hypothetical protein
MKKVIALLFVCGFAIALVSCGKKTDESSTVVDSSATVVEQVVDSSATVVDSAATTTDTAAVAQ